MKIIIENIENLIKGDSFVISVPETAEQKVSRATISRYKKRSYIARCKKTSRRNKK